MIGSIDLPRKYFLLVAVSVAVLSGLFTYSKVSAVENIWTNYVWDIDTTEWDIWWQSPFATSNSSYSNFPTDVRYDLTLSAYAWDEGAIGTSLEFEEICYSCGGGEDLFMAPISFSAMDWDEFYVLGKYSWSTSGTDVLYGAVWLDNDADWNNEEVDIDANEGDVQTVAIHEIGHINGWKHRCVANPATYAECDTVEHSVMTAGVNGTKRSVSSYDQGKMEDKYP